MQVVRNGIAQRRRGVTIDRRRVFSADPYAAYLAYDSFTGTNGTALQSHSPEKGGPWTESLAGPDAILDGSGHVRFDFASEARYTIPGAATGTFIANIRDPAGGSSDAAKKGIIFNYQDANNFWYAGGYFNFLYIWETVAGVETQRGTGSVFTIDTTTYYEYKVIVSADGDTVTLYLDGVSKATYTVASRPLKANTTAGIRFISNGANYLYADLFTIQ